MSDAGVVVGAVDPVPYTYALPEERIAQRPVYPYDSAKLLVIDRNRPVSEALSDRIFSDLTELLSANDLLVLNDTVVKPVRFFGKLGTGAKVELLLTGSRGTGEFEAIARPMRKLPPGATVVVDESLKFTVVVQLTEKTLIVRAEESRDRSQQTREVTDRGVMPIPPYIRGGQGDDRDRLDYQTRFAAQERRGGDAFGSVAAPTASLHFTDTLVDSLQKRGVRRTFLTLDVGLASVLSVVQEDGSVRPPGAERVVVPPATIEAIAAARARGGRVVAVGTTVVRALESYALNPSAANAEIFIRPGHKFSMLDAVITNFHQPASSHLLLVEALIGREHLAATYQHALDNGYRFLSYGDATLCLL
jgi:S-adenosylmethionine:tRNA ribosyltransferase-isomerase